MFPGRRGYFATSCRSKAGIAARRLLPRQWLCGPVDPGWPAGLAAGELGQARRSPRGLKAVHFAADYPQTKNYAIRSNKLTETNHLASALLLQEAMLTHGVAVRPNRVV